MLTTNEKKSLLKTIAAGTCSAIITMALLTATVSATTISSLSSDNTIPLEPGTCLFSIQLAADPALKAAFIAKIDAIKNGASEESEGLIYATNIAASGTANMSFNEFGNSIDSLSNDCLACHDGVMAPSFKLRIKNNPPGRVTSLEDIIGSHPVGMEYDRYVSLGGKEYRGDVRFSTGMVFAEGKVGCLTCHNPLNTDKGHLVMENSRSELCFACHNK